MVSNAWTGYPGISLKQKFSYRREGKDWKYVGVLVGLNKNLLRLRYPDPSNSTVRYLTAASNDLKILAALLMAELVSAGVFADRLEEEFPVYQEAANILREWQQIRNSQEVK
jgi:hypothetical protein